MTEKEERNMGTYEVERMRMPEGGAHKLWRE